MTEKADLWIMSLFSPWIMDYLCDCWQTKKRLKKRNAGIKLKAEGTCFGARVLAVRCIVHHSAK